MVQHRVPTGAIAQPQHQRVFLIPVRRTGEEDSAGRGSNQSRSSGSSQERKQPLGTLLPGDWVSACREQTPIHDHFWTQKRRSQFGHAGKTLKEECLLVQAEAVGVCRRHTLSDWTTGVVKRVVCNKGRRVRSCFTSMCGGSGTPEGALSLSDPPGGVTIHGHRRAEELMKQ